MYAGAKIWMPPLADKLSANGCFLSNSPNNWVRCGGYSAAELRPICDVLLKHPNVWAVHLTIYMKSSLMTVSSPATIVEVEPKLRERTHHDEWLLESLCDDRLADRLLRLRRWR